MKAAKYYGIMMVVLVPIITSACFSGPSNYSECILDEMPAATNDQIANDLRRKCRKAFKPVKNLEMKSPMFGVATRSECIAEYSEGVASPDGAYQIRVACAKIYPNK